MQNTVSELEVDSSKTDLISKSKTKKPTQNAAILAIKRMQEAKKAQEEEDKRLQEEEYRREEEERRLSEEKSLKEEEERQHKRDRRKAKQEELKKQGTRSERERLKRDREQIQLLQTKKQTVSVSEESPALIGIKKKPIYSTQKKNFVRNLQNVSGINAPTTVIIDTPIQSENLTSASTLSISGEECILESWEDALEDQVEESLHQKDLSLPFKRDAHIGDAVLKLSQLYISPHTATKTINVTNSETTNHGIISAPITTSSSLVLDGKGESFEELRSPIICVLGHVDTGKTKLLDKLRETHIQEGEAGGITQQIGATFFPREAIEAKMGGLQPTRGISNQSEVMHSSSNPETLPQVRIPGLVVIDTPGHASFANLRSRGSSLCHLAILVVDILHGLEPQTIESIQLLRARKTPFVVALNKIDRIYGWNSLPGRPWVEVLAAQRPRVSSSGPGRSVNDSASMAEFNERVDRIKLAFATQASLNAELFTSNSDTRGTVSLVPLSAMTGEGIPDLLRLIVDLTQTRLISRLIFKSSEPFSGSVLEVKAIEGLGHVIDAIVTQGSLSEGDRVVIGGISGAICTQVRSLLTPEPMRESRVKSVRPYLAHTTVKACIGVRIVAQELEKTLPGSRIIRVVDDCQIESAMRELDGEMAEIITRFTDKASVGVSVQASTLGSLEALLSFLADSEIPVAAASIGTIFKRDVLSASVILDKYSGMNNEATDYAVILAFDVRVDREAQELAEDLGIKIFQADIIYHLFDAFKAHRNQLVEQRKREMAPQAVFPCILKIEPRCVFNKRSPIILGVQVVEGILRIGTPLAALVEEGGDHQSSSSPVKLGRVTSIELNHRPIEKVRRGEPSVAIKIEPLSSEPPRMVGRHFAETDSLISVISRSSIDILKNTFREEMTSEDWQLVRRLKPHFGIL